MANFVQRLTVMVFLMSILVVNGAMFGGKCKAKDCDPIKHTKMMKYNIC